MRIISLAPSNTEILYSLGLEDSIVGVTRFCDYPADAKNKEKVGGWIDVDYGKIKKLNPDLVITSTFVQKKISDELKKTGIKVLHVDPVSLENVFESILVIGDATNKGENSRFLVENMKKRINMIKKGEKEKVYAEEWHKPPTVCGNWVPELIEAAGGISLGEKNIHSYEVSTEQVKEFNPDHMIVTWCGFGESAKIEWIKEREGWIEINAIKNNKIHIFDDSLLNRPGPRLVEGMELIAKMINGE